MQMMHLKSIDQREEVSAEYHSNAETLLSQKTIPTEINKSDDTKIVSAHKSQLKSTDQIKTSPVKGSNPQSETFEYFNIKTFEDLIKITTKEKEVELKYDLERNVNLVSFSSGKIDITFNEKLNKNFIKILAEKLLKWTGERWIISLSKDQGEKTFYEKNIADKKNKLEKEMNSDLVKDFVSAFPGAKLTSVSEEEDA
jgi:DNA polymerase-3 subunit gamma/tau